MEMFERELLLHNTKTRDCQRLSFMPVFMRKTSDLFNWVNGSFPFGPNDYRRAKMFLTETYIICLCPLTKYEVILNAYIFCYLHQIRYKTFSEYYLIKRNTILSFLLYVPHRTTNRIHGDEFDSNMTT